MRTVGLAPDAAERVPAFDLACEPTATEAEVAGVRVGLLAASDTGRARASSNPVVRLMSSRRRKRSSERPAPASRRKRFIAKAVLRFRRSQRAGVASGTSAAGDYGPRDKGHNPLVAPGIDLQALATYDFEGRSEDDVRADWIEPLLRLLGYGLGTLNDIVRGEVLPLSPPFRAVGRESIKYDIKPTVRGHGLWIIEAKKPVDDLFSDAHLVQVWTYGTDPRVNVPLAVLCDGQRLGVFDLTKDRWDVPEYDQPQQELPAHFDELQSILGAKRVAEWVRRRQLRHLETALRAQLDPAVLGQTVRDVQDMSQRVLPYVLEQQRDVARRARGKSVREMNEIDQRGGTWAVAGRVNGPFPPFMADVDAVVNAVLRQSPQNRTRELDRFLLATRPWVGRDEPGPAKLWWPFRIIRLAAALRLAAEPDCGERATEIVSRGGSRSLLRASPRVRLQLLLMLTSWSLARTFVRELAEMTAQQVENRAQEFRAEMDLEDWIAADAAIGLQAEQLPLLRSSTSARAPHSSASSHGLPGRARGANGGNT